MRASESNLFQLLARVAPPARGQPPEVMIAISNFNLITGGQLNAWLDVRPWKQGHDGVLLLGIREVLGPF